MLGENGSNGSCGFMRPGLVAYKDFYGADKVFSLEFMMPKDGTTGVNQPWPGGMDHGTTADSDASSLRIC